MNENTAFTQEMIQKALMSKLNEHTDYLGLLLQCMEDTEGSLRSIVSGLSDIKADTQQIRSWTPF